MITTFIHASPGFFFPFILVNGILQAAVGAYLQPAVIAIASLFGPAAVQAIMAGQGAVGVVVSGVQMLSATASVWGTTPETISAYVNDGAAEARSALIFFGLSSVFLVCTTIALGWLTAMPAYKAAIVPFEQRRKDMMLNTEELEERQGLISSGRTSVVSEGKGQILRVAKANATYEIAIAYVFIVTLVSDTF
jgi:equilibrative nucleoside transporter 1/2/3